MIAAPFKLSIVETEDDWTECHRIRKEVLHDARGRTTPYRYMREDDHIVDHFPLLLKVGNQSVATARLDIIKPGVGAVRLVAVTAQVQRQGYGRVLQRLVEEFAIKHDLEKLVVNAAPSAVGFYLKNGFAHESWDPSELTGWASDAVQMSKPLCL